MISLAHLVIRYIACHWKHGKLFFYGVVVLTLAGTVYVNRARPTFPMGIHTCFAGYAAFLLGMLLKRLQLTQRMGKFLPVASLVSLGILVLLNPLDRIGLGVGNIGSLPFYLVVSLAGWIMVWGVSALLKGPIAGAIAYCGRHSIWIVLLHFLAFKPVALLYLLITGRDLKFRGLPRFCSALSLAVVHLGGRCPALGCKGAGRGTETKIQPICLKLINIGAVRYLTHSPFCCQ